MDFAILEDMLGSKVLVVEDDVELRGVLGRGLREEGFEVEAVATGHQALERVEHVAPDVLVIDIGLPDTDGRDLCQALRARGIQTPVLFLTAHDLLVDRIAGFDAGGDDYLAKPFALVELIARLQALVRRGGTEAAVEAVGLRLDPVTHTVRGGVVEVPLTPCAMPRLLGLAEIEKSDAAAAVTVSVTVTVSASRCSTSAPTSVTFPICW